MRSSRIKIYPYVWIPSVFLERSLGLISACNAALKPYSNCIEMRSSSIEATYIVAINEANDQYFRYFATRDIKPGEEIMKAPTEFGVSDRQIITHCYNCSEYLKSPEVKPSDLTIFSAV